MTWLYRRVRLSKKRCRICGVESILINSTLGVCLDCIRSGREGVEERIVEAHRLSRGPYGMPPLPPRDSGGVLCPLCGNRCMIPDGGVGYCGLSQNRDGRLVRAAGTASRAVVEWYYDPLPTNCVADPVCPARGYGYPRYSYRPGPEYGYYNLAVFYGACSLDCLYCQNWHYRERAARRSPLMSAEELASKVDERVACICYFGGDPSAQMPHALETSRIALEENRGRILRICWESNGMVNPVFLERAVEYSLVSGGIFKFDIKAWSPRLYKALTGVDGRLVFENFRRAARRFEERPEVPLVVASTLLVPGYVDVEEVRGIAGFIADQNPDIPYILLAFHPDYLMDDLPPTSRRHMDEAVKAAKEEGLTRVYIGNPHLLGPWY